MTIGSSKMLDKSRRRLEEIISDLRDTDKSIVTENSRQETKREVQVCLLKLAGSLPPDTGNLDEGFVSMFKTVAAIEDPKLIACYLLRLLPEGTMSWLLNKHFHRHVIDLLDATFGNEIFRIFDQEPKLGHEKASVYSRAAPEAERTVEASLRLLTSLDGMPAHRQKLMGAINGRLGQIVIQPFLHPATMARVSELYRQVANYIESREELGVTDARDRVLREAQELIELCESYPSLFSTMIVRGIGEALIGLVEEDFATNKAAKPSSLELIERDKKYPLRIDQELNVGFTLRNDGPGFAYETWVRVASNEGLEFKLDEVDLGRIPPVQSQLVTFPAKVTAERDSIDVMVELLWKDFDGRTRERELTFPVVAQTRDVNWDSMARSDPYSLEPVTSEDRLVGRKDVLNRLVGGVRSSNVGSAIIHGQKRVGKTSIAKAFQSMLFRVRAYETNRSIELRDAFPSY